MPSLRFRQSAMTLNKIRVAPPRGLARPKPEKIPCQMYVFKYNVF